jgi:hypothetical protein
MNSIMNKPIPEMPPASPARADARPKPARFLVLVLACLACPPSAGSAELQDLFANREIETNPSGRVTGDNSAATVEPNEPQHGGKRGGHSLWISWVAPADGIATFRTEGSSFDTLLSAYRFESAQDTTLDKLHEVARNDDAPGLAPASLIAFGARAGQRYEIGVDGFSGATGPIRLAWDFIDANSPPPIIVSLPADRAARQGDPVLLSVDLQPVKDLKLQWRLNDEELNESGTNLFIPSLQPTNVGRYSVRLTLGSIRFFTEPTEIQINTEGQTNALARDKLLDAPASALIGSDGEDDRRPDGPGERRPRGKLGMGVMRGYNGSQVFSTAYATVDPNEPPHCDLPAGASYWLAYQSPADGSLALDTIGSSYDTVIEAYTYDGTVTSYANLVSLACDNDGVAPRGAARVKFPVFKGRQYVVVVDGVNAARGTAWLNYALATNPPPAGPVLASPVAPVTATAGTSLTLAPTITGTPPLLFSWSRNLAPISGSNSPSLFLPSLASTDSGDYQLLVTNAFGSLTVTQSVSVVPPPSCSLRTAPFGFSLSWPTVGGQRYFIEEARTSGGPWLAWTNLFIGDGQAKSVDLAGDTDKFYRLRIE